MRQLKLYRPTIGEKRRESLCRICHGYRKLCRSPSCPYLIKARMWSNIERALKGTSLFGASPPAVFVGEWGYPKVLSGPLVPPLSEDTAIMDSPELWVDKSFDDILRYRFSLVRGKTLTHIRSAYSPSRILSFMQDIVMASRPVDVELWLEKKPSFQPTFSPREPPFGPSAAVVKAQLSENPAVPRVVDKVVSDYDFHAEDAVVKLFETAIPQRQITRIFSAGLLGLRRRRRLVPTEWSVTAVDDILGKAFREQIIDYPEVDEFMVLGHKALANSVQILLMPTAWMYEGLEAWLTSPDPYPCSDYELSYGRRGYAKNLTGAYYAARLPILQYLRDVRRQAGAIVFMEVSKEWIPLGVWRFREICREALRKGCERFSSLEEALGCLSKRLELPVERWVEVSRLISLYKSQRRIEHYLRG